MRLRSVVVPALAVLVTLAACRPVPTVPAPQPGRAAAPRPAAPAPTTTTTAKATTSTTVRSTTGGGGGGGGGGGSSSPAPTSTSTTTTAPAPTTTTTTAAAPAPGGQVLWSSTAGWQAEQEPAVLGVVQTDRIRWETHEGRDAMRVELRPYESAEGLADGDVTNTGGYLANRAEVYGRHASPRTTPPAQWPDPIGSTRWYGVDVYVPSDFVTDTTGRMWISLMQWKGLWGGQPAIALEIKNDRFELAGASGRNDLGAIRKGRWERFVVGVHLHPDSGWVEVHRDGVQVLARTHRPTMQWQSAGVADPIYLKQGIYRHWDWAATHVVWFGATTIGTTKDAVE